MEVKIMYDDARAPPFLNFNLLAFWKMNAQTTFRYPLTPMQIMFKWKGRG